MRKPKLKNIAKAQKLISLIEVLPKEGIFISKDLNPNEFGLSLHHCIVFAVFSANYTTNKVIPLSWLKGKYGFKTLFQIKLFLLDLHILGYIYKPQNGRLFPACFIGKGGAK